jgi:hypothetical protein
MRLPRGPMPSMHGQNDVALTFSCRAQRRKRPVAFWQCGVAMGTSTPVRTLIID